MPSNSLWNPLVLGVVQTAGVAVSAAEVTEWTLAPEVLCFVGIMTAARQILSDDSSDDASRGLAGT